jgi:tRNA (guanine-N7-)-methyltransferase
VSVRRARRLPLEALHPFVFAFPESGRRLDPAELFGNPQPTELEVGFGKGAFLVAAAPANRDRNYLGVEIDRGLQLYVATRLAKRGLVNVRVGCGDARMLVAQHLPAGALHAVHVYFPDPWWKTRHRKRRVFTEAFARDCGKVLIPGGTLFLATDVSEYFQHMLAVMTGLPEFECQQAGREELRSDEGQPRTNFEIKAARSGRPVWRATFRRKTGHSFSARTR